MTLNSSKSEHVPILQHLKIYVHHLYPATLGLLPVTQENTIQYVSDKSVFE